MIGQRYVLVAATWRSSSTAWVGRFTSKWRCQCGCRMLADMSGVISHILISGQYDKRILLSAFCTVQLRYDLA